MRVVKTKASRVVKRVKTRGVREKRIPSMAKPSSVTIFARTMPMTLNSEPRIARSKPTVESITKSAFETRKSRVETSWATSAMVRMTVPSTERRISSRGNPTRNVTSVRRVDRMISISRMRGAIVIGEAVCLFKADSEPRGL